VGIDYGSSVTLSKLQVLWFTNKDYFLSQLYSSSGDRGVAEVLFSDDNVTWTLVPEVSFRSNGAYPTAPDPGYQFCYVLRGPDGGGTAANSGFMQVTFDLEAAGLSGPARTHRYWKVQIYRADGGADVQSYLGSIQGIDSSGNFVGMDYANQFVDEAQDADFGGAWIWGAAFIQDRTGLSGKTGINTVDDGDGDGFTDTVTIASGTFNTGVISTVTDRLAWKEPGAPGNGFVRMRLQGATGLGFPMAANYAAEARIISVNTTTIVVDRKIIPDNLANADWEVRRPSPLPSGNPPHSAGGAVWYDTITGHIQFGDPDIGKEYRITKKVVFRTP
jgi:hypothetical protein